MIKLPYGIANFERIVDDNYYYVDKTKYIEILENITDRYILFIRPRRFGKSLFVSILDYYYNIFYKDKFEKLFSKYYIGKNPTKLRNSYLILRFHFSGINTETKESTYNGFFTNVEMGIRGFCAKYNINYDTQLANKDTPEGLTKSLIQYVQDNFDKKIYVLIDEYDHFANELVSFQTNLFKDVVSKNGFVRKFYEELKEGTNSIIDRIFITGVTPLTLDSLTSGFNIKKNLTTRITLNEMMGFTEEETKYLVKEVLRECGVEERFGEVYETMKKYYNGYKFNEEAEERLFNSDMVLYYLSEYQIRCKQAGRILDANVASDYKKLSNLFKLTDNDEKLKKIIETLIEGKEVKSKLTEEFSLEKEFEIFDLISLLFYMGLLTISFARSGIKRFVIPNYVIKILYYEYFEKELEDRINYKVDNSEIMDGIEEMAEDGKVEKIVRIVEEFLKELSKRDYIGFNEKYVKLIFLMYLYSSDIYYVESEGEVKDGYVDIRLEGREIYDIKYNYVIELKYLKAEASEKEVEKAIEEGTEQVKKYREGMAGKVRDIEKYKYYVILFKHTECVGIKEVM